MTEHTREPWIVRDRGLLDIKIHSDGERNQFGEPSFVAFMAVPPESPTSDTDPDAMRAKMLANAETIVHRVNAYNDMLEALKAIRDADGQTADGTIDAPTANQAWEMLEAAIAKAENREE